MKLLKIIIAFIVLLAIKGSPVFADAAMITKCSVAGIRIGDTADNINSKLHRKYVLRTIKESIELKEINAYEGDKKILALSLKDNKVFLISVYDSYATSKKISPGSKLSEVIAAYGKGEINPTDSGYFVFFKNYPGVQFLIDDNDVPVELRGIPDDSITKSQKQKILDLKNAKISIIQVYCGEY